MLALAVAVVGMLLVEHAHGITPAQRCANFDNGIWPSSLVYFRGDGPRNGLPLVHDTSNIPYIPHFAGGDFFWEAVSGASQFNGQAIEYDGAGRVPLTVTPKLWSGNSYRFEISSGKAVYWDQARNVFPGLAALKFSASGSPFTVTRGADSASMVQQLCTPTDPNCRWYTFCTCQTQASLGSCVDFDECTLDVTCPANGHCVNFDPGFGCECDAGFHAEGSRPFTASVAASGICVPDAFVLSVTDDSQSNQLSFRTTTTSVPNAVMYELTLEQFFSSSYSVFVSSFSDRIVSGATLKAGFSIDKLSAGLEHRLTAYELINDERKELSSLLEGVTTSCSCDASPDRTGTPGALTPTQLDGVVTFEFEDKSACREAFSFKRSPVTANVDVSFTADYYHHSARCSISGSEVKPGQQAADDLRRSKLAVGSDHTYCVEAVRAGFSPSLKSCFTHTVAWEASVSGKVTLKKSAGLLPVENVTAHWRLLTSIADGVVIAEGSEVPTAPSGQFSVAFNIDDQGLENSVDYPLEIYFTKTTTNGGSTIEHTFLCEDETEDCSGLDSAEDGSGKVHVVYLRHLDFKVPVVAVDDTSEDVRGVVVIDGTEHPGSVGCPIFDVEVCAVGFSGHGGEAPGACVRTNSRGEYALPVTTGTTVSLKVSYAEHNFTSLHPTYNQTRGVKILADGTSYAGFDFVDTTVAPLNLEVVGGGCDAYIGNSEVTLFLENCPLWEGKKYSLAGVQKGTVQAMAHRVQLGLTAVTQPNGDSREEVKAKLLDRIDMDLTEAGEEEEGFELAEAEQAQGEDNEAALLGDDDELQIVESEEAKDINKTAIPVARFQYDGSPQLNVTFIGADEAGECTQVNGFEMVSASVSDSFHAIGAPRFNLETRIDVVLDLGEVDGVRVTCDNVGADFDIRVTNLLGLSPELEGEQPSAEEIAERERVRAIMENRLPSLLQDLERCNAGCVERVVHEELTIDGQITLHSAHVLLSLGVLNPAAAQALPASPDLADVLKLTKTLTVQTLSTSAEPVTHEARVLLYGDYALGAGPSIPLPTHKPALVLRDPPGGNSYAYYSSVQTHIRVDVHEVKRFAGFRLGAEAAFGSHAGTEFCGLIFGVGICNHLVSASAETKAGLDFEDEFLADLDDFRNTGSYTARYNFKTSDDAWLAGHQSDVFLVPSVFVAYVDTVVSSWDAGTCTATAITTDTFDVDNGRPSLTFAPVHAIRTLEIPALEAKIAQNQALVDAGTADEDDTRSLLNQQAALASWDKALDDYDKTNAKAREGKLVKADKWYKAGLEYAKDKTKGMKVMTSDIEPRPLKEPTEFLTTHGGTKYHTIEHKKWLKVDGKGKSPKSGLMPPLLAKGAKALEAVLDAEGNRILPEQEETQLGTTNIFTFYGGGSEYAFELDHSFNEFHEYLTGSPQDNSDFEGEFEASHEFEMKSFGMVSIDVDLALNGRTDREERIEKTDETRDTRGFVLGDPDGGDKFDVEVFLDPKYGTFVFTTLGGRSRCPHEPETTQRQAAEMDLIPPAGPVLPNDVMVFDVALTNSGFDIGSFEIEANNSMNSNGLLINLNSGTLARPVTYEVIGPRETIKATIAVQRGPSAFLFEPVQVSLRPQCESIDRVGEGSLAIAEGRSVAAITLYNSGDPDDLTGANPPMIKFEEPCPGIELFGEMQRTGRLVVNANSASTVTVTARNLETSAGSFLARASSGRLEHSGLFFQLFDAVDKTVWSRAELPGGAGIDIDFAAADLDNEYGFHTALWSVQEQAVPDGFYELEARTTCVNTFGAPEDFDLQTSSRIQMVVDTIVPRVFGAPTPASGVIYPGQAVAVLFDEPINCGLPFIFDLDVRVPDLDPTLLAFNSLQVSCKDDTIRFTYDAQDAKLQAGLYGTEMHFTLSGVEDLYGNEAASFDYSFSFASLDLDAAATEFNIEVDAACDAASLPALEAQLLGDLAAMINTVDASRIVITELRCSAAGSSVIAGVTILPVGASSESNSTSRRRSLQGAEDHSLEAYTALADVSGLELLGGTASVQGWQLIVGDEDKAQAQATTSTLVLPDERAADQIGVLEAQLAAMEARSDVKQDKLEGEIRIVLAVVLVVTVGGFIAATAMVVYRRRRSSGRFNDARASTGEFGPKIGRISSSNPTYSSSDNVPDAYEAEDIPDIEAVEADEV